MNNEYILTTYYVFYEQDNVKGMIKVRAKDKHQARKKFAEKFGTYKGIKRIEEKD